MDVPGCNVCHEPLDEDEHQPRHLGCSHDACTACIKALIINGSFVCPLCRTVIKANKAEDLLINHGVVQILRLFNSFKITEYKQNEECVTTNAKEFCSIHKFIVDKRCITCKAWICVQCKQFHTSDIGCEVQEYNESLKTVKNEHKEQGEPTLSSITKNLQSLSSKISGIDSEKKRLEGEIEKLNNLRKNLEQDVEDGTKILNEIVVADSKVDEANNSKDLNESVHIANEWYQFAQIWCKKNAKSGLGYSLIEKLKSDQDVYASMDINGKRSYSKLSIEDGNIYLHCFRPLITPSSNVLTNEQAQALFSADRDLVFFDLAISGVVKGRVTIRLRQDLPTYAKTIPHLFTGEKGHSLLGLHTYDCGEYNLGIPINSITNGINFKRDSNAGCKVTEGSILARWESNSKMEYIYIYHGPTFQPYGSSYEVFGQVELETELETVKLCKCSTYSSEVTVVDCGLVIKEDLLRNLITH